MKALEFLHKIIRIRAYLIHTFKCKDPYIVDCYEWLKLHLENLHFKDNSQAEEWIRKCADRIRPVIPGNGSGCHNKLITEFNRILES